MSTDQDLPARPPPALRYERWLIGEIEQDPENARGHSRRNIDEIKASLRRFGQLLPVVIRHGRLVGGNATHIAAFELGLTHLDVAIADHLSEDDARRAAVALNRTGELAHWKPDTLIPTLHGFAEDLEGTGFNLDDLAALEQLANRELPGPAADESGRLGESWSVLVTCSSEQAQQELLGRLTLEGYECRALIS